MDISVIVPCHNLEKYIQPLLNSLSSQSLYSGVSAEVIFVLDNCTDKTEEIISEWIERNGRLNPSIIKVNVHSCGLARNAGLLRARGNWIWFVDGDDWIMSSDAFSILVDYAYFTNAHYIHFQFDYPETFKFPTHPAMVWQYLFDRNTLANLRFTDIQPHEDKLFMEAYSAQWGPPVLLHDQLYYYNYGREGSNIQQFLEKGRIDQ